MISDILSRPRKSSTEIEQASTEITPLSKGRKKKNPKVNGVQLFAELKKAKKAVPSKGKKADPKADVKNANVAEESTNEATIDKPEDVQSGTESKREANEDNVTTPTKKKRKQKHDPLAPKRPLTPYMVYCKAERTKISGENPQVDPRDITRLLGTTWNSMSPTDKEHYGKGYKEKFENYVLENAEYISKRKSEEEVKGKVAAEVGQADKTEVKEESAATEFRKIAPKKVGRKKKSATDV